MPSVRLRQARGGWPKNDRKSLLSKMLSQSSRLFCFRHIASQNHRRFSGINLASDLAPEELVGIVDEHDEPKGIATRKEYYSVRADLILGTETSMGMIRMSLFHGPISQTWEMALSGGNSV